jgi:hypothetical protein
MPSTRYTVRLPPPLDAAVQARVRQGTPFAVLMRAALTAYLADTPPTGAPTGTPIPADSADTLRALQAQLAAVTQRLDALEQARTPRRQRADREQTGADAPAPPPRARGQYKLTPRQVRTLRAKRARGTPIKALLAEYGISKATLFRYLHES